MTKGNLPQSVVKALKEKSGIHYAGKGFDYRDNENREKVRKWKLRQNILKRYSKYNGKSYITRKLRTRYLEQ